MAERLEGKVAIVAGAGSSGPGYGNGKATAVLFAREGAKVVAADIDPAAAEETRSIIDGEGGECIAVECDVSRDSEVREMVEACVDRYGRVDILHNNVGITEMGGPVETSEESWDRVASVNLKSVFLTCKHVLSHMERQGRGAIVNVSSTAGLRWHGVPYISYSATKAAVIQLTQSLALQYASRNIRCNCVVPGFINTPLVYKTLARIFSHEEIEEIMRERDRQCPTGKMGDAWDVAHAALFLASDEAKYITGTRLVVDGGLTCTTVTPGWID